MINDYLRDLGIYYMPYTDVENYLFLKLPFSFMMRSNHWPVARYLRRLRRTRGSLALFSLEPKIAGRGSKSDQPQLVSTNRCHLAGNISFVQ